MLKFRPDNHTYWDDTGLVPGVTTVIETICQAFANIPDVYLIPAQDRGTAVHKATELDDLEMLDEDSLDIDLMPYLEAWRQFRADMKFEPERVEKMVYHPAIRYAGTLDRTGTMTWKRARRKVILDVKTGPKSRGIGLQLAAYQAALKAELGDEIKTRVSVHLKPDGKYMIEEYTDTSDLRVFLAMLTSYKWMKEK